MTAFVHGPFEPALGTAAKRAISDKLPPDVAVGAVEFITGPLLDNVRPVTPETVISGLMSLIEEGNPKAHLQPKEH